MLSASVTVLVLVGCGPGLGSESEAADGSTASTTRAPTTTSDSAAPSSTSTTPTASDRSTTTEGADPADDEPLGIGDYFPESGNPGYDVRSYDLALDMEDDLVTFDAEAEISLRTTESLDELRFDLDGLDVSEATIDGTSVTHRRAGLDLVLEPEEPLPADETVAVMISYSGTPTPRGSEALGGLGWIGRPGSGSYVASEPDGASNWFPSNDHPSDKATFSFEITTPEGVEAVANGTRTGMETEGGRTTWSWSARDPMATYLATVAVGQYTFFEGEAPDGLPLLSAVADEVVEREGAPAVEALLGQLPQMVTVLTQRFGPYPFEVYGALVVAEPLGFALETQTRSIFGDDLWAEPVIQAHELAHQWYGNSVGLEQWEDIWLNEGFATMGEWIWAEGTGGRGGPPLSTGSGFGPPLDPGPDDLFENKVYLRGGLTLKALRAEVGDETFFEILSTWAADHRLATATTDEFLELVEQVGGADAAELVRAWLTKPTPPS